VETQSRGPINVSGVAGFGTGTADPDDLRRVVTASPGYRRVSAEEQGALLEIVLRVGTTPAGIPAQDHHDDRKSSSAAIPAPRATLAVRRRWWRRRPPAQQ
jgi:hypothetical protein